MNKLSSKIREHILRISNYSKIGHIPASFSVIEIMIAIYQTINHNPKKPYLKKRDYFILSKGHASLGLYCTLALFKYFDIKNVYSFGKSGSSFGGHPDRKKIPGVEISAGSLGHGIGIAVGIAMSAKIRKEKRKVIVLIGDGEANEGTVWESILVAVNLNLNNLIIIYDNNKSQKRCLQIENPKKHFKGFGCDVLEVDGHNINEIKKSLKQKNKGVKVIIANTTKGKGCISIEKNIYEWHRRSPNSEELKNFLEELNEKTI